MIGPAHLILMFWFGGAICFASIMFLFAKFAPDDFEKTGVTLPIMVVATMVWPYAMLRAFQMVQQESQWRERRQARFPDPSRTPMVLDFSSGSPQALVLRDPAAIPPTPCESCDRARAEWDARMEELYRNQPELCVGCAREWKEWVARNAVRAE